MLTLTALVSKDYVVKTLIVDDGTPLPQVKSALEEGIITVWGSSELTNQSLKYISNKYLPSEANTQVVFHGQAYHQSFVIMSQLAAFYNQKIQNNAKIVIFLSPGWFATNGTNSESFSKYMTPSVLSALLTNTEVPSKFIYWTSEYIKLSEYNNPSIPMIYTNMYKYWNSENNTKTHTEGSIVRHASTIKWDLLEQDAISLEAEKSTSNDYGINDDYYFKYVEPNIKKKDFPYNTKNIHVPKDNREYQDFLKLVDLLKLMKIKPLFIMQDLNPHTYKNLDRYEPVLKQIKEDLKDNNFPYLDLWSWGGKTDYQNGSLTDSMHTGELGWVKINRFILEYYGKGNK